MFSYWIRKSPPPSLFVLSPIFITHFERNVNELIRDDEVDVHSRPHSHVNLDEKRSIVSIGEISTAVKGEYANYLSVSNRVDKIGVIDFQNPRKKYPVKAEITRLSIAEDNLLIIRNWNEFGVLWIYKNIDFASQGRRIAFEINGKLVKATWVRKVHKRWPHVSGGNYLWPTSESWTPTPEPSTYGAVVSVCALGVGFWRKRKSRFKQSLKKRLGGDTRAT